MLCVSFSPIKLQEELPEGIKAAVGTCIHFKSSPMHFASIMELIYFWNYILCFGLYKTCVTGLKIQCTCNGQSMDNVWTDWGVCQSTFCLAGLVDQSHSIILKKKKKKISLLLSCFITLCMYVASSCVLRNFDLNSLAKCT